MQEDKEKDEKVCEKCNGKGYYETAWGRYGPEPVCPFDRPKRYPNYILCPDCKPEK